MKTKANKNLHKQDSSQDLEANPSKDGQKQKARYVMLKDGSDHFFYGACPECGKEGQLNNINDDIWGYCELHNTAWYIANRDYDPQGVPEFCRLVEDRGYKEVAPIMTRLETPENRAAMLEEMQAISVAPILEFHLVDQDIQLKEIYGLHPIPDACTVQVRFENGLSKREISRHLKLIVDKFENEFNDFDDLPF